MNHYKFERCDEADPNRCQGLSHNRGSQCPFKAVEGSKYCPRHAGNSQIKAKEKENVRIYLLEKWKAGLARQADHPQLKSLREELGILRMTLEMQMNRCEDEAELMMRAGAITEMVREITKTARICHDLEKSVGAVLDKTQATQWVLELGQIIAQYVDDPDILEFIAADMLESLERRTNGQATQSQSPEHNS
jgi:hypothetical protein